MTDEQRKDTNKRMLKTTCAIGVGGLLILTAVMLITILMSSL